MERITGNNSINFNFTNSKFFPDDTAKGLFLFLIYQTLITLAYQLLHIMGLGGLPFITDVFGVLLSLGFAFCVYYICKEKKINFYENTKLNKAPSIKQVVISLGISLICIFGFSALTNLFLEILYKMGYQSVSSDIVIGDFGTYILCVITICIIPAVCEEILFRGLICNGLKKIGSGVAVFGSAFLFMIMHGSPDQTVHQFILGVILAIIFLVSNNLWVPILVHFFNNFIAVTFSYIAYGDSAADATTETAELYLSEYLIYAVISAVISGILVYLLLKLLSKSKKSNGNVEPVEVKVITNQMLDEKISYVSQSQNTQPNSIGVNEEESIGSSQEFGSMDPVIITNKNKLTGVGRAMYVISIVWLAIDWISALILGFGNIY